MDTLQIFINITIILLTLCVSFPIIEFVINKLVKFIIWLLKKMLDLIVILYILFVGILFLGIAYTILLKIFTETTNYKFQYDTLNFVDVSEKIFNNILNVSYNLINMTKFKHD